MNRQATSLSALDAIFSRRSVRAYTEDTVDAATIRSLLDAAVQAPTALHEEPWAFVIVQNRALLAQLSERAKGSWGGEAGWYRELHPLTRTAAGDQFAARFASPDFCLFYDAGTLILVCARHVGPFAHADCWLAAENLMIAASALGLGTCCIGSALPVLNTPATKVELGIPPDVDVVVPVIVGVPREAPPLTSRQDPVILSWKDGSQG